MNYGCIGARLTHSFSAEIHALIGKYSYKLREIAPDDLPDFLQNPTFSGINVTIPYKQTVIPYLAHIHPKAAAIGAVNTVVNRQGELYGYNTDYTGLAALIARTGVSLSGKKVIILGSGGTSLTARCVAEDLGAAHILRASRNPKEPDTVSYETLLADHTDGQFLINTTPCGMFPNLADCPIHLAPFQNLEGLVDVIYNPLRTRLVQQATAKGIPALGGLYMLVAQAVAAAEHFLSAPLPADTTEKIYNTLLNSKENIVLTGMPSCGKTTVGNLLAAKLNRPFVDVDEEIIKAIGCSIPDYFARFGEDAFRQVEAKVIAEVIAPLTGCVIATGGGAILREENVVNLRHNGRLYFLDRPLTDLCATADRPTANSREAIQKRYEERYDRYCATADRHISVTGDAAQVAQIIAKDFVL